MKWFKNYFSLRLEGNLTFIKLRGLKKIQLMYHPNHFNINFKLIARYIFIISNILLIINTKLKTALHMLKNRKFHINSLTKKTITSPIGLTMLPKDIWLDFHELDTSVGCILVSLKRI